MLRALNFNSWTYHFTSKKSDFPWTPHRRSRNYVIAVRLFTVRMARRFTCGCGQFPPVFPVTCRGGDEHGHDFPRDRLCLPVSSPRGLGPGAADRGGVLAVWLRRGNPDPADEEPAQSRWVAAAPPTARLTADTYWRYIWSDMYWDIWQRFFFFSLSFPQCWQQVDGQLRTSQFGLHQ